MEKTTPAKTASSKIAFLGLGVMGAPMAGHLKAQGHAVTVYNRTQAKAEAWLAKHGDGIEDGGTGGSTGGGGTIAASTIEAAAGADFVFACVGDDDDLRQVTLGDRGGQNGAFDAMAEGAIFIDNTTASAAVAEELHAEAKKRGLGFIDAPVSGGEAGAESGTLTVMCGGDPEVFAKAAPIIAAYAKTIRHIGGAGTGQKAKMVNQICIAALIQGLAEGLNFGRCAELDMDAVLDTIAGGAAQSWQMQNRGSTMLKDEFDFGFALDWMIKDLKICIQAAKENGADLTVTEQVLGYYQQLSEQGFGRNDTSALIRRLR